MQINIYNITNWIATNLIEVDNNIFLQYFTMNMSDPIKKTH